MAQDRPRGTPLLNSHHQLPGFVPSATAKPIAFPTGIVLRKQKRTFTEMQAGNDAGGEEDDFTHDDLRQMLWDYAANPAPPSDLAGLTKKCIDITCTKCGTRVIKVPHELRYGIKWEWVQNVLFSDFKCFYCVEGYPTRLEAYRLAKTQWDEDSQSEVEKALRRYLGREFATAEPHRSADSIAILVDNAVEKIKKQDENKPPVIGRPPVAPEVPEPAWRSKIGGMELDQGADIKQDEHNPTKASSAATLLSKSADQDARTFNAERTRRKATVEAIEEKSMPIKKNANAEVLLDEIQTIHNTTGTSHRNRAIPKARSSRAAAGI